MVNACPKCRIRIVDIEEKGICDVCYTLSVEERVRIIEERINKHGVE